LKNLFCAVASVVLLGSPANAAAQTYPSRPVTLIVPVPAGEPAGVLARLLAEHMARSLGQPLVIENIANGPVRIMSPAPDGYTFAISNTSSDATNLKPVALLPSVPAWIVARKTLPVADLKELTVWLKARSDNASAGKLGFGAPGKASAGIIDSDGPGHICTLLLQNATGTNIQVVPYYSTASMLQGLVRGQIDFICDRAANSVGIVHSGDIKAYAVMAKTRWSAMPNVPTGNEMDMPIDISYWHGLWAPKGTPNDIVATLNAAAVSAMADSAVRRRIADMGMEIPAPDAQSPEALAIFQRAELAKWCEGKLRLHIAIIPHAVYAAPMRVERGMARFRGTENKNAHGLPWPRSWRRSADYAAADPAPRRPRLPRGGSRDLWWMPWRPLLARNGNWCYL
jgi:tripartite-type tricarboxylate transporter receptor subunit TctC